MFSNRFRYIYIALLGTYSFANIKFTEGDKALSTDLSNLWLLLFILLLTTLIWESNRLSQQFAFRGRNKLSTRLILRFLASLFFVGFVSMASSFLVGQTLLQTELFPALKQILGFTFRINLFLHCINAIYSYNKALSTAQLEAERLKKQSTEAKLETLKSQINPHFLFNNLNTLTSIIEEDAQVAVRYTQELSKVYRYLLKNEAENLVSLKEELSFLQSYVYLLKIRFQEHLTVRIDLPNPNGHRIPPSTLQLLVENAIKHNEASAKHPLHIAIFEQSAMIVVQNNIQPRTDTAEKSGVGLKNIQKRYKLLSSNAPEIEKQNSLFVVRLPVI